MLTCVLFVFHFLFFLFFCSTFVHCLVFVVVCFLPCVFVLCCYHLCWCVIPHLVLLLLDVVHHLALLLFVVVHHLVLLLLVVVCHFALLLPIVVHHLALLLLVVVHLCCLILLLFIVVRHPHLVLFCQSTPFLGLHDLTLPCVVVPCYGSSFFVLHYCYLLTEVMYSPPSCHV